MKSSSNFLDNISRVVVPKLETDLLMFCQSIVPQSSPQYISVIPEPFSQTSECFINVERQVSKNGGKAVYGWQIWHHLDMKFLEAEFHGVWENKENMLIDITPKPIEVKKYFLSLILKQSLLERE